jgi:hypothetical protein
VVRQQEVLDQGFIDRIHLKLWGREAVAAVEAQDAVEEDASTDPPTEAKDAVEAVEAVEAIEGIEQ